MGWLVDKVEAYFVRRAAARKPKEERGSLKCPWCRQWHSGQDEQLMRVWPPVADHRYLVTCSNCGGGAVWDYGLAPVPLLHSTPKNPVPMEPQIKPAAQEA